MKKTIRILTLLLAFMLATFTLAAAETIDLTGMTYEELVALKDRINLAIWQSEEWQEVTVPQGVWKVGEDIPAGHWTVTCAPGWRLFYIGWGDKLAPNGQSIDYSYAKRFDQKGVYNPDHERYEVGDGMTTYSFEVYDGDFIVITKGDAVFTPYAGKPALGFN